MLPQFSVAGSLIPAPKGRTLMAGREESATSSFRRWPNFFKRGGLTPDNVLVCYSWGLNCISIPFGAVTRRAVMAPGPKSKLHDPELTELAEKINEVFRQAAAKKGAAKRTLGLLLLDEGVCLTWETPRPELDKKTDEEVRQMVAKDLELLSAKERKALFDI